MWQRFFLIFCLLPGGYALLSESEEISKPLLRVFPTYRFEECEDWAIRPFICKRCIWEGKRYAQKIFFYEDGPYRLHGCYTDKTGFEELENEERR